jgi:hypothetical protein
VVVSTADEKHGSLRRRGGRFSVGSSTPGDQRGCDRGEPGRPHGQVAGLAAPLVTFAEMVLHQAPPSPIRWKTWSNFVLESVYVWVS